MDRKALLTCFVLLLFCNHVQSAVVGIDFGSEFYKAVLVKPGSPFNIVENTSSKRKTENAMTFTNEERAFEKDAVTKSVSFPQSSLLHSLFLLGKQATEDNYDMLKHQFLYTNEFYEDARGLIGYQINIPERDELANVELFVEEIMAMIFQHVKGLAKKQADGAVNDVTITVPSYFTPNQRVMVKDAAELAGFNVLSLVNENTAAALMYGIDTKDLEPPKKVMFVNMGASDLELSVVNYDQVKGKKSSDKDILSLQVLDEAAVPDLGGKVFDVELVKILAERFDALPERQGKPSVLESDKIVRRLMREVVKLKEILSSNKEVPVKVVELADGLNLEFTLQRAEFEKKIQNLIEKARPAFEKILMKHPIDTIDEVEILGGGLRVPKMKDFISQMVSGKTLSTHLNPDEAMAFGSAYIAANFSSSYQVQKVYLYQNVPETIYLNVTQMGGCEENEDPENCFTKHMVLFDEEKNVLGQKKTIKIDNHIENMDVTLYKINAEGNEEKVLKAKVRGVETVKNNPINDKESIVRRRHALVFKYDKSGILDVKKAEVTLIEEKEEKSKKKDPDAPAKVVEKEHKFDLKVTQKLAGPQPLTAAQKSKAKKRMRDADKRDKEMEKLKVIMNEYESLIYSTRDFINDEDVQPYLNSEDDKEKILMFLDNQEEWLYGEGSKSDYDTVKSKVKILEKKSAPIKKRKRQREQLPEEISKAKKKLDDNEISFKKYVRKRREWLPKAELEEYNKLLTETREYLDSKAQILEETPLNDKLKFTIGDMTAQVKLVTEKMKHIKRLRKPKENVEVESHGEVATPDMASDVLKEQEKAQTESFQPEPDQDPEAPTAEELNGESSNDENLSKTNVTSDDPQGDLMDKLNSEEYKAQMKAQVEVMKNREKLKHDFIAGKIDVEDLTPEMKEVLGID